MRGFQGCPRNVCGLLLCNYIVVHGPVMQSYVPVVHYTRSTYFISQYRPVGQERPYNHDSTASRLLSEVKHDLARLVLRWGTTLE
jgi:hypothetical protein